MMSHGVDIDRFNVITDPRRPADHGRVHPDDRPHRSPLSRASCSCLHRMGVERDASVFRTFDVFVRQGDRFVEPIAITRKSRRVLDHTFPGMFLARVLGIHEPSARHRRR